jgi:hypothetical protein
MSSTLGLNDTLTPGQSLSSPGGAFIASLQGDGNFVVYRVGNNTPLWSSNTSGKGGVKLIMQGDGNLVLYTSSNKPVWATNTGGKGASFARMQDDGNLVVYVQGNSTFATNTQQ